VRPPCDQMAFDDQRWQPVDKPLNIAVCGDDLMARGSIEGVAMQPARPKGWRRHKGQATPAQEMSRGTRVANAAQAKRPGETVSLQADVDDCRSAPTRVRRGRRGMSGTAGGCRIQG